MIEFLNSHTNNSVTNKFQRNTNTSKELLNLSPSTGIDMSLSIRMNKKEQQQLKLVRQHLFVVLFQKVVTNLFYPLALNAFYDEDPIKSEWRTSL